MIYTYLLKSSYHNIYYTGISKNPEERLIHHNSGKVYATKLKKPWFIVYKKAHENYTEARKHEKWLKKKNHQYKDKLAG